MKPYHYPICCSLLLLSCKQKEVSCSAVRYKVPSAVAFKGYTAPELQTILVRRYVPNTTFQQWQGTDTIRPSNITLRGDTAYATATYEPLVFLYRGSDYELVLPAASHTYRISSIHYSNDTIVYWTRTKDCGTYGTFTLGADGMTVDGRPADGLPYLHGAAAWIILQR